MVKINLRIEVNITHSLDLAGQLGFEPRTSDLESNHVTVTPSTLGSSPFVAAFVREPDLLVQRYPSVEERSSCIEPGDNLRADEVSPEGPWKGFDRWSHSTLWRFGCVQRISLKLKSMKTSCLWEKVTAKWNLAF